MIYRYREIVPDYDGAAEKIKFLETIMPERVLAQVASEIFAFRDMRLTASLTKTREPDPRFPGAQPIVTVLLAEVCAS